MATATNTSKETSNPTPGGGFRLENVLVCPITQELFVEPVLAEDGHTYERSAISRWFNTGNTRSPVTNEELEGKKLVPNHVIRKVVHHHRHSLGMRLVTACEQGEDAEVMELVEKGADINIRTESGETPLLILISRNRLNLARELVRLGADASIANDRGETPEAAARRRRLDEDFMMFLQDASRSAAQKRASEAESRIRERDEYRRMQQMRRTEQNETRGAGATPLVPGVGFFPSLFSLQFLWAIAAFQNTGGGEGTGAQTNGNAVGQVTLSQRITNWARVNIAGDPDLAAGQEDYLHQQILSRALLTVGSMVLLCLLLL